MLTAYLQTARRLATNDQSFARLNDFDLRDWCNIGRNQIAGESECIRDYATLAVTAGQQIYPFSTIVPSSTTIGIGSVIAVRDITYGVASGKKKVYGREWEWFNRYILSQPVPIATWPRWWAQHGQGVAGTIFVNLPDFDYTLYLDTACLPIVLVDDTTPEAIPLIWTDAVPYFACYMAYLQLGDKDKAGEFFQLYQMFMDRARKAATPSELPHQFAGTPDPTLPNKLGIQQRGAA